MANPACARGCGPRAILLLTPVFLAAGAVAAQEATPPEAGLSLDLDVVAKQLTQDSFGQIHVGKLRCRSVNVDPFDSA